MQAAQTPEQLRFEKLFKLRAGKVFRRKDLADKHPSVDRVRSGLVCKAAQGLYHLRRKTLPPALPSRMGYAPCLKQRGQALRQSHT